MYDPLLYQRDRGEFDWDRRSIVFTSLDGVQYDTSSSALAGYHAYLNRAPNSRQQDIELSQMDSLEEPLLRPTSRMASQQQEEYDISESPPQSLYDHNDATVSREVLIQPQEQSYSDANSSTVESSQRRPFEPIPHRRQGSDNSFASSQFRSQSPALRPYSPQRLHSRQNSGTLLLSQLRSQMSSPSPPREQPSGPRTRSNTSRRQTGQPNDSNKAGGGA